MRDRAGRLDDPYPAGTVEDRPQPGRGPGGPRHRVQRERIGGRAAVPPELPPVSAKMASVVSDTSPGIRRRGRLALVSGSAPAAKSWQGRRATAPVWLSTVTVISRYG